MTRSVCPANLLRTLLLATFACAATFGGGDRCAAAQTAASNKQQGAGEQNSAENRPKPFTLDLGDFHVRDWRPTRNETPDLRFSVAVVFAPETSELTRERLRHWTNRLRDQAIIAVRLAESKDFVEPTLDQLQRLIRGRIRRTLPGVPVSEVLMTDFSLGDD
ncbi:MAG: hypothetical protein KF688_08810 [Pirellulales bacterium]|nr:hypothetical protein [Pirellulales bacterium]